MTLCISAQQHVWDFSKLFLLARKRPEKRKHLAGFGMEYGALERIRTSHLCLRRAIAIIPRSFISKLRFDNA